MTVYAHLRKKDGAIFCGFHDPATNAYCDVRFGEVRNGRPHLYKGWVRARPLDWKDVADGEAGTLQDSRARVGPWVMSVPNEKDFNTAQDAGESGRFRTQGRSGERRRTALNELDLTDGDEEIVCPVHRNMRQFLSNEALEIAPREEVEVDWFNEPD